MGLNEMSYSLNSLKGVMWGIIWGTIILVIKGDTWSSDCSSHVVYHVGRVEFFS